NIDPYLIDLTCAPCQPAIEQFLETDILIVSIPPYKKGDTFDYLLQLRSLVKLMEDSPVNRVLFISSTSVYPDLNRIVDENDAPDADAIDSNKLLTAEKLFTESNEWLTTVVRFAGLVGENRHPGKFLAGRTGVALPESPVNIIHQSDAVELLRQVVLQNRWGEVYNACADEHPMRQEFYTAAAQALKLTPPQFEEQLQTSFKIISNKKIKEQLGYAFQYPDPMQMI
ncbi:MAG: SDR family NAD(P)-dependent oxidoreductase, partial [Hymenobacteraceae bacterium]|nr:SDR family NAD(P)-dependent oxidoreductase [Hymenobacteraceae bacterium]MDX5394650.1 SDR family NAD(P)-dependent oxidoreductase [Hymenobacteraceae bacterium]MDX5510681.1 SDR family NAD(P)-dependent oxidoreductase [Hymenobacteraceae bacterium]